MDATPIGWLPPKAISVMGDNPSSRTRHFSICFTKKKNPQKLLDYKIYWRFTECDVQNIYPNHHKLQEPFRLSPKPLFCPLNQGLSTPPTLSSPSSPTWLSFLPCSLFSLLTYLPFSFCFKMLAVFCPSKELSKQYSLRRNFQDNCLEDNVFSMRYKYLVGIFIKREGHEVSVFSETQSFIDVLVLSLICKIFGKLLILSES